MADGAKRRGGRRQEVWPGDPGGQEQAAQEPGLSGDCPGGLQAGPQDAQGQAEQGDGDGRHPEAAVGRTSQPKVEGRGGEGGSGEEEGRLPIVHQQLGKEAVRTDRPG